MTNFLILTVYAYVLLLIEMALKSKNPRKNNSILILLLILIPMCIISGFRNVSVGMDTHMYFRVFQNYALSNSFNLYQDRFEFGYRVLNYCLAKFTSNPEILIFISSVFILSFILKFYKDKSKCFMISVIFFIQFMGYYNSMNIMRQYIAIAIGTFAYKYSEERKLLKFLLIVFIAMLFHTSAFCLIIIYLFPKIRITKKNTLKILSVGVLVSIFMSPILRLIMKLLPKYTGYIDSKYYTSMNLGTIINIIVFGVIFLVKYYSWFKKDRIDNRYEDNWNRIEYFTSLFTLVLVVASLNGSIIARSSEYLEFCTYMILINSLIEINDKRKKILLIYTFLTFSFVYNISIFILRPEWHGVVPYIFGN